MKMRGRRIDRLPPVCSCSLPRRPSQIEEGIHLGSLPPTFEDENAIFPPKRKRGRLMCFPVFIARTNGDDEEEEEGLVIVTLIFRVAG